MSNWCVFGSTEYLDEAGRPNSFREILQHPLVGYDRNEEIIKGMQERGIPATKDTFALRCDSHPVIWELIRSGAGLGISHVEIGRNDPLVEEIDAPLDLPVLPVWLAAHQALRHTPRIARVWDALESGLRERLA